MDRHMSDCEMSRQGVDHQPDGQVCDFEMDRKTDPTAESLGAAHLRTPPREGAAAPPSVAHHLELGARSRTGGGGGASMRTGRGQHARGGDCGRGAARVLATAAGGGARGGRGRARRRRRVPFWARAHGGKVAGRRGAAPGRAASATPSRFPAPAAPPWTTSVSKREAEGRGSEGRAAPGRAGASELWGLRDPTLSGPGPRIRSRWLGPRSAGSQAGPESQVRPARCGPHSRHPPASDTAPPPDPRPRGSTPIFQLQGPALSTSRVGPPLRGPDCLRSYGTLTSWTAPPDLTERLPN